MGPAVTARREAPCSPGAHSDWVDRLARIGLAARGLVYLVIAWIAGQIAFGGSSRQADRQGAIHTLASNTLGMVLVAAALLTAVAAGLAAFGAYSFAEARYRRTDS